MATRSARLTPFKAPGRSAPLGIAMACAAGVDDASSGDVGSCECTN